MNVSYSQNFLMKTNLVDELIKLTDISNNDVVFDIGAGKGIITGSLLKVCKKVIAIEVDKNLVLYLKKHYGDNEKVEIVDTNFINYQLPNYNYKVFSNIPFNYTSRIFNKLFFQSTLPKSCYLIMQKEASHRYIGYPRNTIQSLILKSIYNVETLYTFFNTDFYPRPSVSIILISLQLLDEPFIGFYDFNFYKDFISYVMIQKKLTIEKSLAKLFTHEQIRRLSQNLGFNSRSSPSELSLIHWVKLFEYFKDNVIQEKKDLIKDSFNIQFNQQSKQKKFYKSRTSKRNYIGNL